jgi:hypothetical protein
MEEQIELNVHHDNLSNQNNNRKLSNIQCDVHNMGGMEVKIKYLIKQKNLMMVSIFEDYFYEHFDKKKLSDSNDLNVESGSEKISTFQLSQSKNSSENENKNELTKKDVDDYVDNIMCYCGLEEFMRDSVQGLFTGFEDLKIFAENLFLWKVSLDFLIHVYVCQKTKWTRKKKFEIFFVGCILIVHKYFIDDPYDNVYVSDYFKYDVEYLNKTETHILNVVEHMLPFALLIQNKDVPNLDALFREQPLIALFAEGEKDQPKVALFAEGEKDPFFFSTTNLKKTKQKIPKIRITKADDLLLKKRSSSNVYDILNNKILKTYH